MSKSEQTLRRVELFADLSPRQLRRLAGNLRERSFAAGTTVVREGEMSGVGFFVVGSGVAAVTASGREIGKLRAGDHFGELALIADRERTATVSAETELVCLELPVWDFRELVRGDGELGWKLLEHVVGLLFDERAG